MTVRVSSFMVTAMGTLSFVRRHSTLIAFTVSLGASAVFVACGSDSNNPGTDGGTGGATPDSGTGGSTSTGGKSSGGSAGKGGTGGVGTGGKGGTGGLGTGGKGGTGGTMMTSNGDAATDGATPDAR